MIQEVTMYEAVCDGCGLIHYDTAMQASKFKNKSEALGSAIYDKWTEIDGKLYCPYCYEYDEETDEYKPKKKED